jgi:aminoglycoside 6-adenylyltransferase
MRSEQEISELILTTARANERVRVVIMNGSRANLNAPRDIFQDFDIVYLVTDVTPFRRNLQWIERFGALMILQLPEEMQDPPPSDDSGFGYLMQFADGNRIDLGIYPLDALGERVSDSLTMVLLDKDGIVGPLDPPSERDYLPQPPTAKAFADCCNEFWWVCPYVAKGLWRQEILYAKTMLDQVLREQLMKMLAWHIGVQTGFRRNPGKFGKHFQRYLEPEMWRMVEATYAGANYDHTWDALFAMCDLFERIAVPVAGSFRSCLSPRGRGASARSPGARALFAQGRNRDLLSCRVFGQRDRRRRE